MTSPTPSGQPSELRAPAAIRAPRLKPAGIDFILLALVLASACIALTLGPTHIGMANVLRALVAPLTHAPVDDLTRTIIWQLRLPRIVLEALVGSSLAVAGLGFQALLRNDLAEPYTTGVSAGSSVGAGIAIVFGVAGITGRFLVPLSAFVCGTAVIAFIYTSARRGGRIDVRSMLLLGVVATAFLWAIETLLLSLAGRNADQVIRWLMGSLAGSDCDWLACGILTILAVIGILLLTSQAYAMNLYAVGEISAQQLGLDVERFKRIVIVGASLLTAATVSVAGTIAFVGLVVPHIARRLARTPDHRVVLPVTIFAGALMMIWSDTIARVILGGDRIPVGVVTAFWGGPFFWHLLRRGDR